MGPYNLTRKIITVKILAIYVVVKLLLKLRVMLTSALRALVNNLL